MNFMRSRWNKYLTQNNQVKFAIVFTIINLHTLRHLSLVLFLVLYAPTAIYVTVQFARKIFRNFKEGRWTPFLALVSVALLGTITSLAIISPAGALFGLSRLIFAVPVFFALYLYTDSYLTLRKHLATYAVFFVAASLTLPLQLLTGPIPWFAASSERADLERYTSVLGSLTALGIIVGSYLVLSQAIRPPLRLILVLVIVSSAIISLQKSAIVNILIGVLVLVVLNRHAYVKLLYAGLGLAAVGAAAYGLIPPLRDRLDATLVSFGISDGSILNYDQTIITGALDRITKLPALNFAALADIGNPLVYVFGGGFGMANTALVPDSDSLAPMAHNQFVEAVTVFGFLGGGILIASLVIILVRNIRLYRSTRQSEVKLILLAYGIFLVNSVFANGTLYQPASASIYYLAMFLAVFGHLLVPERDRFGVPTNQSLDAISPELSR